MQSPELCIVWGFYGMCSNTFSRKQTSLNKKCNLPFGKKKIPSVYGPAFWKKVLFRTGCCLFSWHSPRVVCEANQSKVRWRQRGQFLQKHALNQNAKVSSLKQFIPHTENRYVKNGLYHYKLPIISETISSFSNKWASCDPPFGKTGVKIMNFSCNWRLMSQ